MSKKPRIPITKDLSKKVMALYKKMSARKVAEKLDLPLFLVKKIAKQSSFRKRDYKWTNERLEYLKSNYANTVTKELLDHLGCQLHQLYNKAHRLSLKKSEQFLKEMAIRSNLAEHGKAYLFKKGQTPPNKGKKQVEYMSQEAIDKTKATRFKKGRKPHNTKSDGEITIRESRGIRYKWVRISEGEWIPYHHKVWKDSGRIFEKGMNLIFRDGDSMNCKLENLEYLSDKELMNRNSIVNYPPEIRKAMHLISKLNKNIVKWQRKLE